MASESTTVNVVNQAIADPSTVGLASFGIALFTLSFFNAGILGPNAISVLIPTALFTALIHFFTAIFGFKKNELFTALVFGIYGMFWAIWGILNLGCALKWYELDVNTLLVFCIAFTIFTAIIFVATLVTNKAVIITLALLLALFICLDLGLAGIASKGVVWAGYIGIIDALMALYICAAGILNTLYGRTVLGVGPVS
jgi:succinate-acetate transporter protein